MKEAFINISEMARLIGVSKHTIYKNPRRYHMFKVGDRWRADNRSLESFRNSHNNVTRLALVGRGGGKCRSSKEAISTGLISQLQTDRELDALLAPVRRRKHKNTTTS